MALRNPRKKSPPRKPTSAAPRARRGQKAKALAVNEPVKREAVKLSLLDRQAALFRAMLAWSAPSVLVNQQAAFWEGFASPSAPKAKARRRRA